MKTMGEMVRSSDEIVRGEVDSVSSVWRDGRVETDAIISVSEGFKGSKYSLGPGKKAKNRNSAPKLRVTTFGGTPKDSPLSQHMPFAPQFAPDEEVILFLKYPESDVTKRDRVLAASPNSKVPTSPRIVGLFQGKFTVFTDTTTKQKFVTRLTLDSYGIAGDSEVQGQVVRALASNRLGVTSGPIVASRPEDAPPMSSLKGPQTVGGKKRAAAVAALSSTGKAITVMPVEDFVNQINESAR
jgi:hypothetical protein